MKKLIFTGIVTAIIFIFISNPALAIECLDGYVECHNKCIPDTEFCLNVSVGNIETMSLSNILADYIIMWYNFIIGAIGILATVMIMYGGLKWLTSRGNSAAIGDAKEKISSALIGLVLVFLSYTILHLVNPNLVVIKMPGFPDIANVDYTIPPSKPTAPSTGAARFIPSYTRESEPTTQADPNAEVPEIPNYICCQTINIQTGMNSCYYDYNLNDGICSEGGSARGSTICYSSGICN